jgi:peptidoglycan/xylan/chitin deacetylase (PgdA/CDA1 family)
MNVRGLTFGCALALGAPAAVAGVVTASPPAVAADAIPSVSISAPVVPRAAEPSRAVARARLAAPALPVRVYHPARPSIVMRPGAPPAVVSSIRVREPVVFITIDDGYFPDPRVATLARDGLPMSVFLVADAFNKYPAYYTWLAHDGARVENHTLSHPFLPRLSLAAQTREICRPIGAFAKRFGARPHLFRPPYGGYNADTLRAVRACGLGDVFMWDAEMRSGHLSTAEHGLRAGDIVLLHWRPELYLELRVLFRYLNAHRLGVGSLEEYVVPLGAPRAG